MGVYDCYSRSKCDDFAVQLKVSDNSSLREYCIGDKCDIADGIYIGLEGYVAVYGGKVVYVGQEAYDKWGGAIDLTDCLSKPLGG